MSAKNYAIDFGTYAIKIYKYRQGIRYHQKSVIAMHGKNQVLAIGDEAYEMVGKQPDYISVRFPIRGGVIADYETMISLFNCISMDMAREGDKMRGADFLVAVPTEVTDVEKKTFYDIIDASIAKPKKIRIAEKPLADAIGCGIDIHDSNGALMVNIGADTTEISVLSQGGIVLSRLCPYGGYRFDEAIINAVRRMHNLLIGQRTAETVKLELVDFSGNPEDTLKTYGRDYLTGLPRERELTCALVNEAVAEPLAVIADDIKSVLERIPPEISADVYKSGIYVSGASSGLKGLDRYLYEQTGLSVRIAQNGATSVVEGLGRILEDKDFSYLAKPLRQTYYEHD